MSDTRGPIDPQDFKKNMELVEGNLTAQVQGEEDFESTSVYYQDGYFVIADAEPTSHLSITLSWPNNAKEGLNTYTYKRGGPIFPMSWVFKVSPDDFRYAETGDIKITIDRHFNHFVGEFTFVFEDGKQLEGKFEFKRH